MKADQIARINELAAIAKNRELTSEESSEREELRARYRAEFREGFRATLESARVQNPDGTLTPLKRKREPVDEP